MVLAIEVLRKIVGQVFLAWVPLHIKQSAAYLVSNVEKTHLY